MLSLSIATESISNVSQTHTQIKKTNWDLGEKRLYANAFFFFWQERVKGTVRKRE